MEKKRYLSIGSVIGETFNLYFSNFLLFCLPSLVVIFPFGRLQTMVSGFYGASGIPILVSIISYLISLFLSFCVYFYLTIVVLKRYKNETVDIKESVSSVFPRILPYSLLNILIFLGIILWSLLLIIPGIIYFASRCIADVIMINEGLGIRASIKRSRLLTKKRRFIIVISFGILLLLGLILLGAYYALLGFTFQGGLNQFVELTDSLSGNSLPNIAYALATSCLMPLFTVMSIVIYMNLLKEKEGFETEQLTDSFLEEK